MPEPTSGFNVPAAQLRVKPRFVAAGRSPLIGVYGGSATAMPMMELFDKQVHVRTGQANVKTWIDQILPLVIHDSDRLGTEDFATHRLSLEDAPGAYEMFQRKEGLAIKVVLKP